MFKNSIKQSVSVLAILGAFALVGCETTSLTSPSDSASASLSASGASQLPAAPLAEDPLSQAAYWGARYEEDPTDMTLAVRYSASLRALGSLEEASLFMARINGENANDPDLLAEYAKVLVAARRGEEALTVLGRVITLRPDDWRLYSLEGIAHDQVGDYDRATQSYEQALHFSPNNVAVLNNYALSRALAGDLDGAEIMLEAAIAQPDASAQSRQNLALVKGLRGDFSGAERLSRADLAPPAVENNMAYYRSILTQPAAWTELDDSEEASEGASE